MPITKNLYDNKYISLYEEYNFRAFVKMAEYQSIIDSNNKYDIITDIKIIDTTENTVIYSNNNIFMAYNTDGLVSITNYIEKILFYLHTEVNTDMYWKRLFIDKVFQGNTLKLELYYNKVTKQFKEEQEIQRVNEYRQIIEDLKKDIQAEYNKKGIAVFYNIFDIYFINEPRLISQDGNNYEFIKRLENNFAGFEPFILNHIKLSWMESDIKILNNLLKGA